MYKNLKALGLLQIYKKNQHLKLTHTAAFRLLRVSLIGRMIL